MHDSASDNYVFVGQLGVMLLSITDRKPSRKRCFVERLRELSEDRLERI